eukprot:scaffold85392_cov30-Tisochrysis_lutea.AAC.6
MAYAVHATAMCKRTPIGRRICTSWRMMESSCGGGGARWRSRLNRSTQLAMKRKTKMSGRSAGTTLENMRPRTIHLETSCWRKAMYRSPLHFQSEFIARCVRARRACQRAMRSCGRPRSTSRLMTKASPTIPPMMIFAPAV